MLLQSEKKKKLEERQEQKLVSSPCSLLSGFMQGKIWTQMLINLTGFPWPGKVMKLFFHFSGLENHGFLLK